VFKINPDHEKDLSSFTSTSGIATTATINDTAVKVFVLGPCAHRFSADSLFMANFEEYKAFREVHGRAPYIHEHLDLFHWCSEVRLGYKKREQGLEVIASNGVKITVGREALIRSVGFDFVLPSYSDDNKRKKIFDNRIKALKQYKENHVHLNIRKNGDYESKSLRNFITDVRNSYHKRLHQIEVKQFKLTDDRYDTLNAIGFPFEQTAKPKFKQSVPTKPKHRPTPSQPATSKHAIIEESVSPSHRHSRIKRKPVTCEEDFDDSLISEVSGSK